MSIGALTLFASAVFAVELVMARVAPRTLLRIAWVSLGPPKPLEVHPSHVELAVPQARAASYRASGAERAAITDVVPFPVEVLGEHGRLVPLDGGRSAMLVPTGSMLGSALRLDAEAGREPNELMVHGRFTPVPLFFAIVAQISFIALYVSLEMGDDALLGLSALLAFPLLVICGRAFVVTRRGFAWAVELTEARLGTRHHDAPTEEEPAPERAPARGRVRHRDRARVAASGGDDHLAEEEALAVERTSRAAQRRRARAARTEQPGDEPGTESGA